MDETLLCLLNAGDQKQMADALDLAVRIVSSGSAGPRIRDISTGRTDPLGATWRLPGQGAVSMSMSDMVRLDIHTQDGGCISIREPIRLDQANVFDASDSLAAAGAISRLAAMIADAEGNVATTKQLPAVRTLQEILPALREWTLEQVGSDSATYRSLNLRLPSPYSGSTGCYRRDLRAVRIQTGSWMRTGTPSACGKSDGHMEPALCRWLDRQLRVALIRPAALEVGHTGIRRGQVQAWAIEAVPVSVDSLDNVKAADPVALVRSLRDIGPFRLMAA